MSNRAVLLEVCHEPMSESFKSSSPNSASQGEFLRVFLANEREILRYVCAIVPSLTDAQEIVQQTAVVLWEKFGEYDHSRPFAPWACRFALNVARQWMDRRQRWKSLLDGGLAEDLVSRREQLRSTFDDRLDRLDDCLRKLPAGHRELVEQYYFFETDALSLAEQAKRTVDAVYKSLQRIRRRLRDCIERSLKQEPAT